MKKIISVLLSILMIFSIAIPAVYAVDFEMQDIPIIMVPGTGNAWIYDAQGNRIYPDDVEITDVLLNMDVMGPILKELAIAMATGNWEPYADSIYDAIAPIFEKQILDKNGEASDGSGIINGWTKETIKRKTSNFGVNDYVYLFDERLDPYAVAKDLHEYIDAVLEVTGAEKVGLIGRCYGTTIVTAYLEQFGDEDKIDTTVMYCPQVTGIEYLDTIFTGNFEFDPDNIDLFVNSYLGDSELFESRELTTILTGLVTILNFAQVLGYPIEAIVSIYDNVKDYLMPKLLRDTYARKLSYWSMVSPENYEEARNFIFSGVEDEYAGFLEKTDNYNYNVKARVNDILDGLIAKGMKITVVAKYGTVQYPIYGGANAQSDNSNSVKKMSFGATASPIDQVLSKEYIAQAKSNGTDKYISADLKIDASTAYYKDYTWFIKDCEHANHPACINSLMLYTIQRKTQATVWDNENYPQFMRYISDAGALVPIDGPTDSDKKFERNPLLSMINTVIALIKLIVNNLFGIAIN